MVYKLYEDKQNEAKNNKITLGNVFVFGTLVIFLIFITLMLLSVTVYSMYTLTLPVHYYEAQVVGMGTKSGFRTTSVEVQLDNNQLVTVESNLIIQIGDRVKVKEVLNRDKSKVVTSSVIDVISKSSNESG